MSDYDLRSKGWFMVCTIFDKYVWVSEGEMNGIKYVLRLERQGIDVASCDVQRSLILVFVYSNDGFVCVNGWQ